MEEPLISIIIPVYKVEAYIHDCVDSVLNQTYSNIEIILVDDGSPDSCGAICDNYAQKNSRVKVVHKENGGLSSARNAGLDVASGDFIGFVDSDDFVDHEMYEKLLNGFLSHPNIGVSSCMIYRYTEHDTSVYNKKWAISTPYIVKSNDFACELITTRHNFTIWSKLYKKELLSNVRFREGVLNEDTLFIFDISKQVELLGVSMVELPFYGYYYRFREGSICSDNKKPLDPIVIDNLSMIAEQAKDYNKHLSEEIIFYKNHRILNFYLFILRNNVYKNYEDEYRQKVMDLKYSEMSPFELKIKLFLVRNAYGLYTKLRNII